MPGRIDDACAEPQASAGETKPTAGSVPDVDRIETLARRTNALARSCVGRIAAVKARPAEERQPPSG